MIKRIETSVDSVLNDVLKIWLDSNEEVHGFVDGEYWRRNYDFVKESMKEATIYGYYKNSELTGFIGLVDEHIAGLFVKKEYRGQGIGKKLLDKAKQSVDRLELNVYARNSSAVNFYSNNGFKQTAERIESDTQQSEYVMIWSAN